MGWYGHLNYRRSVQDFKATAGGSDYAKKLVIIQIISKLTAQDIEAARIVGAKAKMAPFRTDNKNEYLTRLHKHLETLPSADLFWLNKQVKDVGLPKVTRAVKHTALIKKEKAARLTKD
jgi:hypothetical protein